MQAIPTVITFRTEVVQPYNYDAQDRTIRHTTIYITTIYIHKTARLRNGTGTHPRAPGADLSCLPSHAHNRTKNSHLALFLGLTLHRRRGFLNLPPHILD